MKSSPADLSNGMKVVIMAGGSGTRLWPVSRKRYPKQVQPMMDKLTMVQKTFSRLRRGWPREDIFVSTNVEQYRSLQQQLPTVRPSHFILEPVPRDTSAAIGFAAVTLWKKNRKEFMFTASSDHYFREVDEYIRILKTAQQAAHKYPRRTVLIGIKPTYPHTGLGYIKMERPIDRIGRDEVFSVERFVEKPNLAKAKQFVARWQYLWNLNMFMFRVDAMLDKYRRFLPHSYRLLMRIAEDIGTSRAKTTVKRLFPKMDKIAIDYGINEHDHHMLVVPADVTWADIGSWREVYDMLASHPGENVVRGRHVIHDSSGNLIYSITGKLIATTGLKNMIIVETDDAILVCPRDRSQDVKKIVEYMKDHRLHHYL